MLGKNFSCILLPLIKELHNIIVEISIILSERYRIYDFILFDLLLKDGKEFLQRLKIIRDLKFYFRVLNTECDPHNLILKFACVTSFRPSLFSFFLNKLNDSILHDLLG